jgi:hypothetical protein
VDKNQLDQKAFREIAYGKVPDKSTSAAMCRP